MAGRPRSFDRDAALAAAVELFWREGYDRTSVAMLTAAMGVTPPSLYAAFGDKHRLFEEAAQAYYEVTCDALAEAAATPSVVDAVARMLDETAQAHAAEGTPPGCLLLTEPRLGAQREAVRVRLRDRIDQGVRDGELAEATDADALATYLVAVMRGMSGCARDGGTLEDLRAIARTAVAALPVRGRHGAASPQ